MASDQSLTKHVESDEAYRNELIAIGLGLGAEFLAVVYAWIASSAQNLVYVGIFALIFAMVAQFF